MIVIKIDGEEHLLKEETHSKEKEFFKDCKAYKDAYGYHFNKKLCECAISRMVKNGSKIVPVTKETLDNMLTQYGITLKHNILWDYVYVANMCKADFFGSSVIDEHHLVKYVKDVIDDEDGYEGMVFNRWLADVMGTDTKINWEEML